MHMAAAPFTWTADDLDRLPYDDGNKYELVDGRLLVTPAPSLPHEAVIIEVAARLRVYAARFGLGSVFHRNDLKFDAHNRVDPDLSVVLVPFPVGTLTWATAPRPILVVEVLSRSTRTHDLVWKADLYAREGIPDCWIVDHRERAVHLVRPGHSTERITTRLEWRPAGVVEPLTIDLPAFFDSVIGPR
jgi:Uma2 family endonuclease